jgi:hypothetical protein
VLSVTAALVIAVRDLRHERVARRRCTEEETHGYDHAAHG